MLKRAQVALMGLLVAAVAAMGWQQWRAADRFDHWQHVLKGYDDRLSEINDRLKVMNAGGDVSADDAVTIRVVDEMGKPVTDSLLTFSWKNGGDTYDQFSTGTDGNGGYTTPLMFRGAPLETVTVSAPGRVPTGYSLNRPFSPNETLTLQLKPEIKQPFRLFVIHNDNSMRKEVGESHQMDLDGSPRSIALSNTQVLITSRELAIGRPSQRPWSQSSGSTDESGVIVKGAVSKGDIVYISAWTTTDVWNAGPIEVTGSAEPIRVEMKPAPPGLFGNWQVPMARSPSTTPYSPASPSAGSSTE